MKTLPHLAWLLVSLIPIVGCSRDPAGVHRIVVTGSSTIAPLMNEIGKEFEQLHAVRVDVQTGGSSRGLADVRQGLADLGMVSRDPRPDERDVIWYPLARDGVGLIVHQDNPLDRLDRPQIEAIYTGEVDHWAEVGGREGAITVVHKAEGRSTLEVFLDYLELDNDRIRADIIIGDNQQGIKAVAGDPNAIGYVSIGAAIYEAERGVPIKLLDIGDQPATVEAVRKGVFPIARTLHLVARAPLESMSAELVAFATSHAVDELVESLFFVPLATED